MEDDAFEGDLGLAERPRRASASLGDLRKLPPDSPAPGSPAAAVPGCLDSAGQPDEVSALQGELDVCRRLLNAKYLAAHILLKQLVRVSQEKEEGSRRSQRQCADLVRELNGLQYELQCMEEHLRRSQQSWLDKLNSVMEENAENLRKLQAQSETLKELSYTAQVLRRERDELLALTDVKERDLYLQPNDSSGGDSSSLEVAVLAACSCRGPSQEPCRCAHAAAHKQRRLAQLTQRAKRAEALAADNAKTVEIYREAFEVQLAKNRTLTRRLVDLQSRKDVLGALLTKTKDTQRSLIDDLVENLCDKNEALVHQQVMVKLLALQLGRADGDT